MGSAKAGVGLCFGAEVVQTYPNLTSMSLSLMNEDSDV